MPNFKLKLCLVPILNPSLYEMENALLMKYKHSSFCFNIFYYINLNGDFVEYKYYANFFNLKNYKK